MVPWGAVYGSKIPISGGVCIRLRGYPPVALAPPWAKAVGGGAECGLKPCFYWLYAAGAYCLDMGPDKINKRKLRAFFLIKKIECHGLGIHQTATQSGG